MSVGCEPLLVEYVVACFHHALVVHVDVGDVYPCSNEVAFHRELLVAVIVGFLGGVLRIVVGYPMEVSLE